MPSVESFAVFLQKYFFIKEKHVSGFRDGGLRRGARRWKTKNREDY